MADRAGLADADLLPEYRGSAPGQMPALRTVRHPLNRWRAQVPGGLGAEEGDDAVDGDDHGVITGWWVLWEVWAHRLRWRRKPPEM